MTYEIKRCPRGWQVRRVNWDGTITRIDDKRTLKAARVLASLLAGWRGRVTIIQSRG